MTQFKIIYDRAQNRHPEVIIEQILGFPLSNEEIAVLPDDRLFSLLMLRVFRAGLKHSLVDAKWPAFEQAFWQFDPLKVSLMSDEQLENHMQNEALIRHWGKIKATRINALAIVEFAQKHGSFAKMIAEWPSNDIVNLWLLLKKQGQQLGGNTAGYFLRMLGKDTFILTNDVVAGLIYEGVITKTPTAKRDLIACQNAFNDWQQQSGRPYCQLSQVLALSIN
ncbi:MAG: DNA-3-methyladenine glycosylase I [Pontibacterium sp.]